MAVKQAQKFTEEELTTLKNIQSKSQAATLKCGQLYLNKLRLEEQEKFLQNQVKELEQEEAQVAQQLTNKYGKGSIDIDTGEFTPTE
jgi:hypothetical protein|tara:strand:+ start:41 stop:301 length:261 start_codon:yes stop_codon:yes gene_type:complete